VKLIDSSTWKICSGKVCSQAIEMTDQLVCLVCYSASNFAGSAISPDVDWLKTAALCWDRVYRMTSKPAPSDPPDVQRIASELGDFLHDIYPEQYQPGPSELDLHQWLRQQVAAERVQTSTEMIELFADKVPPELAEAFDQHGVTARKEHEITAPWWMEEY
jgi:hypothetical protein